MKRITKKNFALFHKLAEQELEKVAIYEEMDDVFGRIFTLQTWAGKYKCHLDRLEQEQIPYDFGVWGRFETPEQASRFTGEKALNRKYNYHFANDEIEIVMDYFKMFLAMMTAKKR